MVGPPLLWATFTHVSSLSQRLPKQNDAGDLDGSRVRNACIINPPNCCLLSVILSVMVLSSRPDKSFAFGQTVSSHYGRRLRLWLKLDHPRVPCFKSKRCFSIMGILRGDDSM